MRSAPLEMSRIYLKKPTDFAPAWHHLFRVEVILSSESGKVCLHPVFEAELLERILDRCLDYRHTDETVSSVIASSILEILVEKLVTLSPKVVELCAEIVFVLLPKLNPVEGISRSI